MQAFWHRQAPQPKPRAEEPDDDMQQQAALGMALGQGVGFGDGSVGLLRLEHLTSRFVSCWFRIEGDERTKASSAGTLVFVPKP